MKRLRLRPLAREERGYSLPELLSVMMILGLVIGGVTALYVSATRAEVDMNQRFQAQQEARLALDRLRREVHGACAVSAQSPATGSAWSVTISLPNTTCSTTTPVTWCTQNLATQRYGLYRISGTTCSGGTKVADYLRTSTTATAVSVCGSPSSLCIFAYTAPINGNLGSLFVALPVDVQPSNSQGVYKLEDSIVLRNTSRI